MPSTSRSPRAASSRLRAGLGTSLALLAALPFAASAHAAVNPVVPAGSGMTMPEGIVVTTSGSVWVTDQALGVCRVDTTADPVALVESQYCKPEPADTDPLATPRLGPGTAHQMAFDPISRNFFVAEGDSKNAGVWRMQWDQGSDSIVFAQRIVSMGGNRVFALALGSGADGVYVDFNGRDDGTIRRLANADVAPAGSSTVPVGSSANGAVASMANLDGALYLAEGGGVTRIASPALGAPTAVVVPGFPAVTGAVPNALAAGGGRVYAGTANVSDVDTVDVLTVDDGLISSYESGFAFVSALGLRPDGNLLIADDPPTAAGAPESLGQSRMFEVPLQNAHIPSITIANGPAVYSSATTATFDYSSTFAATFSCRLDGAATWEPCGDGLSASKTYSGLLDGTHLFEVSGSADSRPASYTFTVDTLAPTASVDNTASDRVISGDALRVRFSADEFGVSFTCALDGTPIAVCEPPLWLRGLGVGEHTFTVTPTDLAANVGATTAWTFTRTPPSPPPVRQDNSGTGSAPSDQVTPVPDSSGPGSAGEQASGSSVATPSCKAIAAPSRKASYKLKGRILTARITPPAGARYAKLTLRQSNRHSEKVALRTISGTKARNLRLSLTAKQAARLRSRHVTIAIAYGTCASRLGTPRALTRATSKSSAR